MPDQRDSCSCLQVHFDALLQMPQDIWGAAAVPVDGLEAEGEEEEEELELHRAYTVGQGHTCLGCGVAGRGLLWEDTGLNATLTDVG